MLSPLKSHSNNNKVLTEDDIPLIRHYFMSCYGWISDVEWEKIPLNSLITMLEHVNKEYNKREELRLCTLKYYGVKNPK